MANQQRRTSMIESGTPISKPYLKRYLAEFAQRHPAEFSAFLAEKDEDADRVRDEIVVFLTPELDTSRSLGEVFATALCQLAATTELPMSAPGAPAFLADNGLWLTRHGVRTVSRQLRRQGYSAIPRLVESLANALRDEGRLIAPPAGSFWTTIVTVGDWTSSLQLLRLDAAAILGQALPTLASRLPPVAVNVRCQVNT
jgi:hypothetical protein